jgi:flagellar hook-associated protein 3 FlgL
MSNTVNVAGYGLLQTLITNAGTVHSQLDNLTEQVSTGLIAQSYAGLGSGANTSLTLSPQIASLQAYGRNIGQATGQMGVAQTALTQIQQIAQTFVGDMPSLNGLDSQDVDSIASNARDALRQLANLLDTTDGNNYVFSGEDTSNPPVPNPDQILSSNFYTQINAAVSALSTNGAAGTAAATLSIASSNDPDTSPFSTYLSQPAASINAQTVQTGQNTFVSTGLVASANTAATSGGSSTTGSYMRDLLRSLATLGSLSSTQMTDPNFAPLIADTTTSLNGAVTAMATDVGVLGTRQAQLSSTQSQLTAVRNALTSQVSDAQEVDMASTISQLTSVQTQLQESYKLIVSMQSLSLANYIPT